MSKNISKLNIFYFVLLSKLPLIIYQTIVKTFTLSQVTEHLDHSPWIHWAPVDFDLIGLQGCRLHGILSFGFLESLLQYQSDTAALFDVVSKQATALILTPMSQGLLQECHGPTFHRYLWIGDWYSFSYSFPSFYQHGKHF